MYQDYCVIYSFKEHISFTIKMTMHIKTVVNCKSGLHFRMPVFFFGGGGDSHVKRVGMLVGHFEKNP